MDEQTVKNIIGATKTAFLDSESYLLRVNANERSMTHKFAECLQSIFGHEWDVDCEYNRFGQNTKMIDEIQYIVGTDTDTAETVARTVYPDIIVHKRGEEGPNLLVIEAKKDADANDVEKDTQKLRVLKRTFEYKFAVFLNFETGENFNINFDFIE